MLLLFCMLLSQATWRRMRAFLDRARAGELVEVNHRTHPVIQVDEKS
jgi:hypothetical protein